MKPKNILFLFTLLLLIAPVQAFSKDANPNIVLIMMDNLGWGELGVYGGGILRGAETPRIDQLANEGMRLLNFNVEAQCTPSRASFMTGRYAIRTGNATIPVSTPLYGLTQWEVTLAEMLSNAGYATAAFGKWHLGHTEGRFPTDQGFDEWFGIPNSSDEALWPENSRYRPESHPAARVTHIMESRKGATPQNLRVFNLEERALIDKELTDRTVEFMARSVARKKPFFLFLPYTQPHFPVIPHPDFKGKTGNGDFADVLAQMDSYVGDLLDEIKRLGIADNTIVIFTSDNGPDSAAPHHGFSGPWRGSYFTALEGSLRAPFIIRWPGKVPAKSLSNEIVHAMDLFPTVARITNADMPDDRIIDGVDQTEFLLGKQKGSNREDVVIYVGNEIYGVKWRNWKMMTKEAPSAWGQTQKTWSFPVWYDLHTDPKEEYPIEPRWVENTWVRWPAGKVLADHIASLNREPPIPPGTPDPYTPKTQ